MAEVPHRAGLVAILGRPNAGKSTFVNRVLGQKLAIVTAKPQTTRSRILGIFTTENAQLLLLDTPGMHAGTRPLNAAMNEMVQKAAADCDVALVLVDPSGGWGDDHRALCAELDRRRRPLRVVETKGDRAHSLAESWPAGGPPLRRISARTGEGVEALIVEVASLLPESPQLYPADQISDRPLRFLAGELVREAAFEALSQELPYALAVEVEEFDEKRGDLVRIRANLLVERASQKQIAIGRGGAVIKRIGVQARREIEALLDTRVHLELWVKIDPRWARRPKRLKSLGYS